MTGGREKWQELKSQIITFFPRQGTKQVNRIKDKKKKDERNKRKLSWEYKRGNNGRKKERRNNDVEIKRSLKKGKWTKERENTWEKTKKYEKEEKRRETEDRQTQWVTSVSRINSISDYSFPFLGKSVSPLQETQTKIIIIIIITIIFIIIIII